MRDESAERERNAPTDGSGESAPGAAAPYSVERWFSATARSRPDATALREGGGEATYAQLDAAATRLARLLRAAGAGPGTPVGILAGRALTYVPAFLGCLRAGAAFVPLDSGLPDLRLRRQLELLRPAAVLAEPGLAGRAAALLAAGEGGEWPGAGAKVGLLCADGLEPRPWPAEVVAGAFAAGPESADAPAHGFGEPDPDSLAYVYFTSGSTGEPKGVAGRLRAVAHLIRWELSALSLGPGVRVSHLLPPSFDGSLRDLFLPLCAGGVICAPPERGMVADAERLARWLVGERVEVIHCVPTLLRALMAAGLDAHASDSLRWAVVAGEALLGEDVRRWRGGREGGARLVNLYGTTETTMVKFCHFVEAADEGRRTVPIGSPIPGARALLLDEEGRPCAPGTVGEVYIRTPYRSLGYYGRPDLTARVFVPNPFSRDPADLVYRTGDLARQLPGGEYEYVGRRDEQVKVRGQRVELGDVEAALLSHASVRECAAAVRGEGEGARLVAYVVAEGEADSAALREHLRERLPAPMVPSQFVTLEALPLTPNGKVDRRALPDPSAAREGRVYEPAVGAVEELMAGVWAEVLGRERVGRGEDFFELGGHSLLATQIMSRVRKAFSVELPLRQLFESPTVAGLAAAVERQLQAGGTAETPPIRRVPRDEPLPLSFVQQRLWFIDQLEPGSAVYNIPAAVRLEGPLDTAALERALTEVVRRHESLRTSFASADGRPVQVISPPRPLRLDAADLSGLPADEREAESRRLAAEEARRPFDLAAGPLFRASLIRLADDAHLLLVTMHHIISDGWSLGVLIREVSTLYSAFSRGEESPLPELPIQYADFAAWQRERLSGEALGAQLEYWRGQLAGAPPLLELPTDRPRQALQTYRGTHHSFRLPPAVSASLKALSREENATLFMTLLAAFDVLLDWYTGQKDIVVGTGVANRTRVETEGLIGFFVNTVVLRTDLSGNPTFREVVRRVREVTLGAYAHQETPFEMLVETLLPERDPSYTPLFQVMFILQNMSLTTYELPELRVRVSGLGTERATAKFDLYLAMIEDAEGLGGTLEYNTDLFDAATAERMMAYFRSLLEEVTADPDKELDAVSVMSDEESSRLIYDFNG